jgi:hypothetical protein
MNAATDLMYRGGVNSLRGAIREVLPPGCDFVVMSSAAPDRIASAVGPISVRTCPTVAGRTVWDAVPGSWRVVVSPNRFGIFERGPADDELAVLITESGAGVASTPYSAACVEAEDGSWHLFDRSDSSHSQPPAFATERASFERRAKQARRLAKRLTQVGGIGLAHGHPQGPRFVILVPADPADVAMAVQRRSSILCEPEGSPLPGMLRITMAGDSDEPTQLAFVDELADAVRSRSIRGAPRP